MDLDLVKDIEVTERGSGWFISQDFIPRISSSSAIVLQGVKPGENPANSMMWTILGYPPVSVAVPMFIKVGENQPSWMTPTADSPNAKMCDMALELKDEVFAVKRGNGEKYLNFKKLHNSEGTGYMQQLRPLENSIFEKSEKFINENRDKEYNKAVYDQFYDDLYKEIEITNRLNHGYFLFSLFAGTVSLDRNNALLICLSFIYSMIMLNETKVSRYKLKELKKYREYLNLYSLSRDNHVIGIEYNGEAPVELNINSLDKYTYKEIKSINRDYKKELKKSKKN